MNSATNWVAWSTGPSMFYCGWFQVRGLIRCLLILVYFLGLQVLAWICLIPWILRDSNYSKILQGDSIGKVWWTIFTTTSFFANVGMQPQIKHQPTMRVLPYARCDDTVPKCCLSTLDLEFHHDRRVSSLCTLE